MPLTKFDELPDSRQLTEFPPSVQVAYMAVGLDDAVQVETEAFARLPLAIASVYGVLYRQPLQVQRLGYNVHEVYAEWAQRKWSALDWTIRGRTTGGTQKILGSLSTVATSADAPDFQGLIGVNADGTVEGTEVGVPALQITIDVSYPLGFVNTAMAKLWSYNTYKVNNSAVLGWAAGEVLYEGSEFEDGSNTAARVSHNVSVSQNLAEFTAAGLNITAKQGWDFLWFLTEDAEHAGPPIAPVKRAVHWYVERIYQRANLAQILGLPP